MPTSLTYIVLSPEAVHLGDLLRIWVRTGTKIALGSPGFYGSDGNAPDTAGGAVLYGNVRPFLRFNRFQGTRSLQRKDNSSRGSRRPSPSTIALPPWGPPRGRDTESPWPGTGILTRFPFGERDDRVSAKPFGRLYRAEAPRPLGPTHPCSTAVHMEPFSTLVLKGLT